AVPQASLPPPPPASHHSAACIREGRPGSADSRLRVLVGSMPTLGFLKKKRTKDGKDSDSPTSPVKDTISKTLTQSSSASGHTAADSAALAKKQSSEQPQQDYNLEKATHHDTPMTSSAGYSHL
ncbi:hypothetical protein LTS18_014267, partial [Coniosporium uncinatum]